MRKLTVASVSLIFILFCQINAHSVHDKIKMINVESLHHGYVGTQSVSALLRKKSRLRGRL